MPVMVYNYFSPVDISDLTHSIVDYFDCTVVLISKEDLICCHLKRLMSLIRLLHKDLTYLIKIVMMG